ncbi:hypothetical protein [Methylobacterium sp. Leaf361]|uniref:hypothetical protein n=1 Tax=Methylobacterium sp. Leaf361 TaxID=1736352 RepID=UPI0012FF2A18|nr:hypothetical protein [Methylobacterium sp. Leaf361]
MPTTLAMNSDISRLCAAAFDACEHRSLLANHEDAEAIVRAVLKELREPSEAMRAAGQVGQRAFDAMPGAGSGYLTSEPYTFAAIIDYVLANPV